MNNDATQSFMPLMASYTLNLLAQSQTWTWTWQSWTLDLEDVGLLASRTVHINRLSLQMLWRVRGQIRRGIVFKWSWTSSSWDMLYTATRSNSNPTAMFFL